MTVDQIIEFALPYTESDKKCRFDMERKKWKRERLRAMLQEYKNGSVVNFEPLKISVDLTEVLQKLNN